MNAFVHCAIRSGARKRGAGSGAVQRDVRLSPRPFAPVILGGPRRPRQEGAAMKGGPPKPDFLAAAATAAALSS